MPLEGKLILKNILRFKLLILEEKVKPPIIINLSPSFFFFFLRKIGGKDLAGISRKKSKYWYADSDRQGDETAFYMADI